MPPATSRLLTPQARQFTAAASPGSVSEVATEAKPFRRCPSWGPHVAHGGRLWREGAGDRGRCRDDALRCRGGGPARGAASMGLRGVVGQLGNES